MKLTKESYTIQEIAKLRGVKRQAIDQLIRRKGIKPVEVIGGTRLIAVKDVEKLL